jgi:exonuclease SbcD
MKLLHTADWHLGRRLHGIDRTAEIADVLKEIAELAKAEAVDLVVVAGDLFDSKNPSAEAEEAAYQFFLDIGQVGIPSVVIAGNHDSPSRLDAVGRLLRLSRVQVVGQPRVSQSGGVFDLVCGAETVRVAALPFVSERRIVKVAALLESDPGAWLSKYRDGMQKLIHNLTAAFSSEVVNLLVLHGTMHGATLARSEYLFHTAENYVLTPEVFPELCNYVALGHIHKAQPIAGYPEAAGRYAGSVVQLDFGELGDDKAVFIVEAAPGRPTELLKVHPLQGGKPLKQVTLTAEMLERRLPELTRFAGYLKLVLELDEPRPGLKDRIMKENANVLSVDVRLPQAAPEARERAAVGQFDLLDAYDAYVQYARGQPPAESLKQAFAALLAQLDDDLGVAL